MAGLSRYYRSVDRPIDPTMQSAAGLFWFLTSSCFSPSNIKFIVNWGATTLNNCHFAHHHNNRNQHQVAVPNRRQPGVVTSNFNKTSEPRNYNLWMIMISEDRAQISNGMCVSCSSTFHCNRYGYRCSRWCYLLGCIVNHWSYQNWYSLRHSPA